MPYKSELDRDSLLKPPVNRKAEQYSNTLTD